MKVDYCPAYFCNARSVMQWLTASPGGWVSRRLTCQLLLIGREGPLSATPGRRTVVLYCPGIPALFSQDKPGN